MPIISALRFGQEVGEFQANLGFSLKISKIKELGV